MKLYAGAWPRVALAALILLVCSARGFAKTIFFSGNLRTNATVVDCGGGCTLGALNSDGDYAQWAAVVATFTVHTASPMEAVTYSFGGGTSQSGAIVAPGGLEPYLSLFDAAGNFLASTFAALCPAGAHTLGGNCYDVSLNGGLLAPGTYQIALTAFENMSLAENGGTGTLVDGFTGLGNLAQGENLNYAFDVILPADVPEPGAATLFLIGCAAIAVRLRISRTH